MIGVTNGCREANDTQCQQARPGQDGPVTETHADVETTDAPAPAAEEALVEESLVEEVSIDGMCGVY